MIRKVIPESGYIYKGDSTTYLSDTTAKRVFRLTKNFSENFFHNSLEIPSNCLCHCSGIFNFLFKKSIGS